VMFFFFQAEDGIRDFHVTGVQTCALLIYVSPELRRQLVEGKVAICRTRGRFRVVPVEVARKVQPIAPYLVVFLSDGTGPEETEDPAYAEHPIPDDLTW